MADKPVQTIENNSRSYLVRLNLQSWLALLALGIALWLIITSIQVITEILLILFITWLLTIAIKPVIDFLARWHIPRLISVLTIYCSFLGVILLITSLLIPAFTAELTSIQNQGPQLVQQAITQINNIPIPKQWLSNADKIALDLTQGLDSMISPLLNTISGLGKTALDVFLVLVLTLFVSIDQQISLPRLIEAWSPSRYRGKLIRIWKQITSQLTRWFWSQIVIALYFAVVFSLGLTILQVPFALSIGLTGGVLEIVPYLGGIVAVTLAIFSALTVSPWLALWVLIFYIVVIEVESHIIAPVLYGRAIGMHPVVVLIALVLGIKAGGILGVFLAVPAAVVVISLLQELQTHLVSSDDESAASIDL